MDPTAPMNAAINQFLQSGLLGAAVLVLGVVIVAQWRDAKAERTAFLRQIDELQRARIDDGKAVQQQMHEVVKQCTQSIVTVTSTLDSLREAMVETRNTIRATGDEIRELSDVVKESRARR